MSPAPSAASVASLALALVACGGASSTLDGYTGATIDTEAGITAFATASAPAMTLYLVTPPAAGSTCPTVEVSGNVTTVRGGCTDSNGDEQVGSYTITTDSTTHVRTVRIDGYGTRASTLCTGSDGSRHELVSTSHLSGSVRYDDPRATSGSFHVDITSEGDSVDLPSCTSTHRTGATIYDGTWERSGGDSNADGLPDRSTWNGSGRVGSSERGAVSAHTFDEVIDSTVCDGEAISGRTEISSTAPDTTTHTAVIRYDGATDCSMDHTVTWTYDGTDRGTLTGVSCGIARGRRGSRAVGAIGIALAGLAVARRRRRS